jgi:hypothetical protein
VTFVQFKINMGTLLHTYSRQRFSLNEDKVLVPGTHDHVTLHTKGKAGLQMKVSLPKVKK